MEIIELYKKLKTIGISPNEFTVLSFVHKGIKEEFNFNEHISFRILKKNGFLDTNHEITEKGKSLFEDNTDMFDPIETFRDLFPKGILPNGRPARSSYREIEDKFKWFKNNHPYSWEIILKATKEYVSYYCKQDYRYMQTSSNFVSKMGSDKVKSSALAEWCEKSLDGFEVEEFDINV